MELPADFLSLGRGSIKVNPRPDRKGGLPEVHSESGQRSVTLFGLPLPVPFDLWAPIRESRG